MTALKSRLVGMIEALGPLPVHEYMALCLFDPKHGYYTNRDPFGRGGDFTTAPEVSQMFGELVGAWLVETWRSIGSPKGPIVAEVGPGRGTLMRDVARTIAKLAPELRANASFRLIEVSEHLAAVQAKTLESSLEFEWHRSVEELPERPLLIFGNEVFDAVPARQYVKSPDGWRERCVSVDSKGNLVFAVGTGSIDQTLLPVRATDVPAGTIFEASPARSALMQQIAEHVERHEGAGLFFDYGHLEAGFGDTLQAILKHKFDGPLAHPGLADLTTHVDFASLAATVRNAGLSPHMAAQGDFLLRLGLVERAGALGAGADQATRDRITAEVHRLAGADAMGDLFKVIGYSSADVLPSGFEV